MQAGPGSVVARPTAGNIGKSVDGGGRSVARDGIEWDGMGWDGMGRAGDGGYLSATVRAEWRLVAAGEGTENDQGMGRDVARLDSTQRGTAVARGMGRAMAHSVRPKGRPGGFSEAAA